MKLNGINSGLLSLILLAGIITGTTVSPFWADCCALHAKTQKEMSISGEVKASSDALPGVVLALSGGGMRGLAHIGVLQAFEEEGIEIKGIAGVSIGGLIGGLYAAGMKPSEITARLKSIDFSSVMFDEPDRRSLLLARKEEQSRSILTLRLGERLSPVVPGAISPGQRLYQHLLQLTLDIPHRNYDWQTLPVPLKILATDLKTGRGITFSAGDLTPALRGTMAVPLLFDPISYEGSQLIDGGISSNIPVETAGSFGSANTIIAVDVTSPLWTSDPPFQPWEVVDRVTTILESEENTSALRKADYIIKPDLGTMTSVGAVNIDSIVMIGYRHGKEAVSELRRSFKLVFVKRFEEESEIIMKSLVLKGKNVIADTAVHACYRSLLENPVPLQALDSCDEQLLRKFRVQGFPFAGITGRKHNSKSGALELTLGPGRLVDIEFIGLEKVPDSWLRYEIPIDFGEPIHRDDVLKGMSNLFATGLFRNVYPVFSRKDTLGWIMQIHVVENPAPLIRLGLSYFGEHMDTQGEKLSRGFVELLYPSPFHYAARMVLFASFGSKDKTYKTSFLADRIFGLPLIYDISLYHKQKKRDIYDSEHIRLGLRDEQRWGGSAAFGGLAKAWGLLTITSRIEQHHNSYVNSSLDYRLGTVGARLAVDTHNRDPFPQNGVKTFCAVETAQDFIGSEVKFHRIWGSFEAFTTPFHRTTLGVRAFSGTADRLTPADEEFRMGGMHNFPGLHLDEVSGTLQIAGGVEARYDLVSRILAESYLGLRFDVGGNWNDPEPQLERNDWFKSTSIYLALDTLLGPIVFQWSLLLEPGPFSKQDVLYIQLGNNF